jgi:membrane protease YdiL (CAAX protease family)
LFTKNGYIDLLFSLAVFGPLLGYLLTRKNLKAVSDISLPTKAKFKWFLIVFFLSFIPNLIPIIYLSITSDFNTEGTTAIIILIYLLSNIITSGTEEFGWRRTLLTYFLKSEKNFGDVSVKTGLIWAVWHYPLMIFLYLPLGLMPMILYIAGFTMAIIAMAYISNWLMLKTNSTPLLMFFHAFNNTWAFAIILIFKENPVQIISILFTWLIVTFIEKYDSKTLISSMNNNANNHD